MTSAAELEHFLGELRTRRYRIQTLADASDASDPRTADLVAELHELGEQLVVADEELRVQQEELDEARSALLSLRAERDLALHDAPEAYVVTDRSGVVLRSTRAARQLVRQPPARLVPRPIASWFEVADRRTVRSMVTRAAAAAGPERAEGVHLSLPDGERLRVDLVAVAVAAGPGHPALLRWELVPVAAGLHAVPEATDTRRTGDEDVADEALRLRLAAATAEVANLRRAGSARQLVGQAVGILIERHHVTAEDAFAMLVKESPDRNVKLRAVASALVESGEGPLPPTPT